MRLNVQLLMCSNSSQHVRLRPSSGRSDSNSIRGIAGVKSLGLHIGALVNSVPNLCMCEEKAD